MPIDVREAGPDDVPALGRSLARAFRDDPVFVWLDPDVDDDTRARRTERFFTLETGFKAEAGTVWCDAERRGAALWGAPGKWRTPVGQGLRLALAIGRSLRLRTPVALATLAAIEKAHPREPKHWYLAVLGTDPDHQGTGIGSATMAPVLERCDHDGVPAYLESSKESNIPYYERFGWKVTGEIPLKRGGPTLYPMWRDPA